MLHYAGPTRVLAYHVEVLEDEADRNAKLPWINKRLPVGDFEIVVIDCDWDHGRRMQLSRPVSNSHCKALRCQMNDGCFLDVTDKNDSETFQACFQLVMH